MSDYVTWLVAVRARFREPCWLCRRFPEHQQRCQSLSGGIIDGAHLIAKSRLKREFPRGARRLLPDGVWETVPRGWEPEPGWDTWLLSEIIWDPRLGVPLRRWHHDRLDGSHLRLPRVLLPAAVEEFAAELGVGWSLDRDFGPAARAA